MSDRPNRSLANVFAVRYGVTYDQVRATLRVLAYYRYLGNTSPSARIPGSSVPFAVNRYTRKQGRPNRPLGG